MTGKIDIDFKGIFKVVDDHIVRSTKENMLYHTCKYTSMCIDFTWHGPGINNVSMMKKLFVTSQGGRL